MPGRGVFVIVCFALACAGAGVARAHVDERTASLTTVSQRVAATLAQSHRAAAHRNPVVRFVVVARRGHVAELRSKLRDVGARVETRAGRVFNVAVRSHAFAAIHEVAQSIRPATRPETEAIPGQGVTSTNASNWQAAGLNGAGSRVAIIDLGFGGLAQAQAAGEINAGAVTVDDCHGAFNVEQHGTAVAEIVSEEAPAALLYLICVDDVASLQQAEQYAVANGANVISHSVGWFLTWSGDGRGPAGTPDAIAADAATHNILWVNAAGNHAQEHWSGTWNDPNGDTILDFTSTSNVNSFAVGANEDVCVDLRWNEWPSAQHDYDLYLWDGTNILARSEGNQGITHGSPIEQACYHNPGATKTIGFFITVFGAAGTAPLDVFVTGGVSPIFWETLADSLVDPAASPNTLAVGAVCWQNQIGEPFSSRGPTLDGRIKPDLVGPDRVSSLTYGAFDSCGGSGGFAGTSAATPYIAGAAALVHQRYPSLTMAQVRAYLVAHSNDLGTPGPDNTFGAGNLMLPFVQPPAVGYPSPSSTDVTRHEATLDAVVTPKDSETTVTFEYGTTTAYGSTATVSTPIAADGPATPVSVQITGLAPNTTYHFRADATNLGGKITGDDQTFTTVPDNPPTAAARRASGRLGKLVALAYMLGDDTGEARAEVTVYRGTTKIATFAQDFIAVTDATPASVSWRAPKKLPKKHRPTFRFCVNATDRAGSSSGQSCAAITLR